MTPTQSLEPSEIAIRGDQFTAVLDGQGCHISIADQRALNGVAHFHKQIPVCATWEDENGSWPLNEPPAKGQGCLHRGRRPKDLGICHDSQEAGEHDLGDVSETGELLQCRLRLSRQADKLPDPIVP